MVGGVAVSAFMAARPSILQTAKSAAVGVWAYTLTAAATRLATMATTRARVPFCMEHLLRAEQQLVLYKLYLTYILYYDIASKSSVDRHREAEANAPRPGEGGRIMESGMVVS